MEMMYGRVICVKRESSQKPSLGDISAMIIMKMNLMKVQCQHQCSLQAIQIDNLLVNHKEHLHFHNPHSRQQGSPDSRHPQCLPPAM